MVMPHTLALGSVLHDSATCDATPCIVLLAEMLVEEARDLLEGVLAFRRARVAIPGAVRLALEDLEHGLDARLAQLAMHAHRVAKQEIACAAQEHRGRKAAHVPIDRREQRVLE